MKQEYEKEDDLCPTGRSSSFSYGQDGANVHVPLLFLTTDCLHSIIESQKTFSFKE